MKSRLLLMMITLLLISSLGILACKKDEANGNPINPINPNPNPQTSVVSGLVRDANTDERIGGAIISSQSGRDTTSNDTGFYRLEVECSAEGIADTVICTLEGYYQQSWPFIAYTEMPRTKDFRLEPTPVENRNATLRGTVKDVASNEAIQGAKVTCAGEEDFTNTNGIYELSVPAGVCTLAVSSSGYLSYQQALELAELEIDTIDVALEEAPVERGRVFGQVTSQRGGEAVPGARVACGDDAVYTDGDGEYELNLPTGDKVVIVSAGGFETQGQDVRVAANGDHRLDFSLNPAGVGQWGLVTGLILNSSTNAGIGGAVVSCADQSTVTDGLGVYTLRAPVGDQTVIASANGYVTNSAPVTVVTNGSHTVNIRLTPTGGGGDQGIVQGRITDNSNNGPINGATVSCAGRSTRSDASGNYSLQVPAGMQTVSFSAPSYTSRASDVNVPAGGRVTLNMALTPGGGGGGNGTVAGRVTDSSNGHVVYLARVQGGGNSTFTDISGNYQLSMAAGNQAIQASADGYTSATQNANVISGQTITVNFALTPEAGGGNSRINGYVKNRQGAAIPGATVRSDNGVSATTNGSGFYQMDVPAGNRTFTASAPGYQSASQAQLCVTNRTYAINFTLNN